jgi:hypothetical protein
VNHIQVGIYFTASWVVADATGLFGGRWEGDSVFMAGALVAFVISAFAQRRAILTDRRSA